MKTTDIYKKLSVRIINKSDNLRKNAGSGFLYITKDYAYVFTAAHVVGDPDKEYEIECFYRKDEVKTEEAQEQYCYQVAGSEFKKHIDYQPEADQKKFNPNDAAGIKLEKRPWMEGISALQFTIPVEKQKICFSGYPVRKWDESIQFSEKNCHTEIQMASNSEKRIQFQYPERADWSAMGDVMEGFSGSGVYADQEEWETPLLVGILTCGQGANILHGSINAVSFQAIKELCDDNSWPSPLYAAEETADGNSLDIPNLEHIVSSNESELIRQLSEEVQQRIKEMRALIRAMKIEKALELYGEFAKTAAYQNASENDKCYLLFIKVRCYFLLGDAETAEKLLEEGMDYTVPEKYWHLVEKANILMNRMGLPDGEAHLEQAERLLEEAIRLGVKDTQAKIFKRYVEAVQNTDSLDKKLAYIHELSTDEHMDLKGMQHLYNVEGTLCAQAGQYEKAAEYFNIAFSFQGDACFLIQSARMYLALAEEQSPEHDLILLTKASNNFVKYLENCEELLANAFYREHGWAFLNCAMELGQYGLIIKHADSVIKETTHPDAIKKIYLMKAFAQIESNAFEYETMQQLDSLDQTALYLHMEYKGTMNEYTELLEETSVYKADAQAGIALAQGMVEECKEKIEEALLEIQAIASKIGQFLAVYNGSIEKVVSCRLYDDWISSLLNCKDAEEYKKAVEQYQTLFPGLTDTHERNRILLPEACGEPDKTEILLLKYVSRNRNPQRMQIILSFYFRNLVYDGVFELYENLLEDGDGIGQFARGQLIWEYLDYLTKPNCMAQKALKQFLKYKDELLDENLCSIIEMRMNHRCYHYTQYDKWMRISNYWINETHHESEYRDAILLSVFNLKKEASEYYYHDYVNYYFPSMSKEAQKMQCPGWLWPYFALTEPGSETGTPRVVVNEKLETMIQSRRNTNPEELDGWKLLRSMEEKTIIIDGPSLYYLSKHCLLSHIFHVADKVVITYSTIGMFLENERIVRNPVIENIFLWIQAEKRIALSEAGLENQCEFREKYGSDGWHLKGNYCLAKERNYPAVGAYLNHDGLIEAMKTHAIWVGDFVGMICSVADD